MAGKITELAAITGAAITNNDLVELVDISDTSMAASGTNKRMTLAELSSYLLGTPQTWNPTITGLTKGNGTETAWMLKRGRTCHLTYKFVFGSTSAVTGNVIFDLPHTALGIGFSGVGYAYHPAGPVSHPFMLTANDVNSMVAVVLAYGPNFSTYNGIDPTAPFTWVAPDEFAFEMTYLTAI